MNPTLATGIGGASGGLLSQVGDAMSAPRRALWSMLGMPEDGASLISQTFHMDPDSPWTRALGMGAEMVGDPLSYAGMALGGPMAKLWGKASGLEAAAGSEVANLTAARRAAQEGLVQRAAMEGDTAARYASQAENLAANHDLASIGGGRTRTYQSVTTPLSDDMTNAGMASIGDEGGLTTLGQGTPRDVQMNQLASGLGGRKYGSVMDHAGANLVDPGNGPRFNRYTQMDPLLPDELAYLQETTKANVGNRWRGMNGPDPVYGTQDLVDDFAAHHAAAANASRPMPTLAMHMQDQFNPMNLSQALGDAPLPQAFEMAQKQLLEAQARKKAMEMGLGDYLSVGGAAYGGGMMGFGDTPRR